MDPREKSGYMKCLRIFFIVFNVIALVLSFTFILLFIINPTLMSGDEEKGTKITDKRARDILLLRAILMSIANPMSAFAIFALYKDNVKFLWFSFAFDIVFMIGSFIFGIHWFELVPTMIGVIVFGCYVQYLSKYQKSLRFDRNLGLSQM